MHAVFFYKTWDLGRFEGRIIMTISQVYKLLITRRKLSTKHQILCTWICVIIQWQSTHTPSIAPTLTTSTDGTCWTVRYIVNGIKTDFVYTPICVIRPAPTIKISSRMSRRPALARRAALVHRWLHTCQSTWRGGRLCPITNYCPCLYTISHHVG